MTGISEQYRTMVHGAGWRDRASGRLRFDGPDAPAFLQALLTNDVASLTAGQGVHAAYLTPQGRMITDLDVLRREDTLLALVPDGRGAELAARFDALIFSEDLRVVDATGDWFEISVTGGSAAAGLGRAIDVPAAALDALPEPHHHGWAGGFVVRGGDSPWPCFRVFGRPDLRDDLVGRLSGEGAIHMTADLAEALRLEAARPLWGRDRPQRRFRSRPDCSTGPSARPRAATSDRKS